MILTKGEIGGNLSSKPLIKRKKILNLDKKRKIININKDNIIFNIKKTNKKVDIDLNEYLAEEPEDMNFEDVMAYDKRTFGAYFSDKLKDNQLCINTFCAVVIL